MRKRIQKRRKRIKNILPFVRKVVKHPYFKKAIIAAAKIYFKKEVKKRF